MPSLLTEGTRHGYQIRQAYRFGTCDVVGEVINETSRAYIYRRPDGETAFISKRAPTLHVGPCSMCADYHHHQAQREAA
jgi:hypothetical protein